MGGHAAETSSAEQFSHGRELVAVILLSLTAVLTAWSGFQSHKWGGVMAISFSEASAARIEASRADGVANRMQAVQVVLFAQWVEASAADDQETMDYLAARFPEPLAEAFTAWQATDPMTDPDAPASPFAMEEYAPPDRLVAEEADLRAETAFDEAVEANERGDNYTLLTVAFASVLFFAGMSGQVVQRRSQWLLVGVALAFFVLAATFLAIFPRRI